MAVFQSIRKFFVPTSIRFDEAEVTPAPPTEYSIKPLTSADASELLPLNLRCFRAGENYTKHTFNYLFNEPTALSYKAVTLNGAMAAYVFVIVNRDGAAHLTTIGVAPEHRRRFLATMLLKHVEAALTAKNVSTVVLEVRVGNRSAIELYLKNGYVTVNRLPAYYSDGEDCFMMVKSVL